MTGLDRLPELERASRVLLPDAPGRSELLAAVNAHAESFVAATDEMPSYAPPTPELLGLLDAPFTERGSALDGILDTHRRAVEGTGVNETVGRFFGFIPGSGMFAAALGDYLAAITNPYAGVTFAAPGAVRLEHRVLEWMAGFLGYPESAAGDLCSGGSVANLSAIVTARETRGIRARDVERTVVYLTKQTHHCVDKALLVAGLRECVVRRVPLDSRFRMEADALEQQIRRDRESGLVPWMVVASAGTTDTGAVDPLGAIADIARAHDVWLHVDGAYGASFALTLEGRATLAGIERSDSLILDPHKGLFMPFGTGALLVREGEHLARAFAANPGEYMREVRDRGADDPSPSDRSVELTRHYRALRLWLPLKLAGVAAFRAALDEKLILARYFHQQIGALPDFEAGPEPDLSVVLFRCTPPDRPADEANLALARSLQQDGRVFLSTTTIGGQVFLRLAVLNLRSHRDDIDLTLELLQQHAAALD